MLPNPKKKRGRLGAEIKSVACFVQNEITHLYFYLGKRRNVTLQPNEKRPHSSGAALHIAIGNEMARSWPTRWHTWSLLCTVLCHSPLSLLCLHGFIKSKHLNRGVRVSRNTYRDNKFLQHFEPRQTFSQLLHKFFSTISYLEICKTLLLQWEIKFLLATVCGLLRFICRGNNSTYLQL